MLLRVLAAAAFAAALVTAQGVGPIALYPLTVDALDVSGNGRHGTINGGVTFSDTGALFAPGSSISIPPILAPALTLRASFYLRSDLPHSAEGHNTLLCRAGGLNHHVIVLNTGVLGVYNHVAGGFFASSYSPQLDTWHNLTAVHNRDGPGSVAMHVDGQWVYRGGGGFNTSEMPLNIIGNHAINGGQYARGWVRHVAVLPYALTDSEVTETWSMPTSTPSPTHTSGTPTSTPTPSASVAASPGPIALYPLTADALDASGNGRHGNINSGVAFSGNGALFAPGSSISIPPVLAPTLTLRASFYLRSDLPQSATGFITLFCREGGYYHHVIVWYTGVIGFHLPYVSFTGSSFSPQLDTWHNVTAVYNRDGPGSVAMHVDGQWVYRGGGGFDTSVWPLSILGNHAIDGGQYARGWMRDVAVWPYALTDSEIVAWNSPSVSHTPTATSSRTPTVSPTPTPTPTPFCPPSRFLRSAAHGLAGALLGRAPATATEQDCASSCCLDPRCEGYTYAPATPPLACALFANVSGVVPNILVDSGVQRTALVTLAASGEAL